MPVILTKKKNNARNCFDPPPPRKTVIQPEEFLTADLPTVHDVNGGVD